MLITDTLIYRHPCITIGTPYDSVIPTDCPAVARFGGTGQLSPVHARTNGRFPRKGHRCTGSTSGLSHYATIGIGSDTPTTYNGAQQHIKKRRAHIHMHPTP